MIPLGHIAGLPVEEFLLPTVASTGASLVVARAWLSLHLRRDRRRQPGAER